MTRQKTQRALELGKVVAGVILLLLGVALLFVYERSSLFPLSFLSIGATLIVAARLGQACVDCRRSMSRREYAFSPWTAHQLREAIEAEDGAAMAEIVRGPRIDTKMASRTSLVLGYCERCKRVTTVQLTEVTPGRRSHVLADQELVGDHVAPLVKAAIDVMP